MTRRVGVVAVAGALAAQQCHTANAMEGPSSALLQSCRFSPPAWAEHLNAPASRVQLARLPSPVHRWNVLPELGVNWFIKRDDLTGFDMGGNKVRKLEFLMADALAGNHDCVITIGGVQSNHCRATAAAARLLGLDCFLILRTPGDADADPGLVGNLLIDRMLGAKVRLVTAAEYAEHGSPALGARLARELEAQGRTPYVIPVGGSNACGTWGYLDAVDELCRQVEAGHLGLPPGEQLDHIVFACGSGGTAAGIGLGIKLAQLPTEVTAVGVCDTPKYFYDFIAAEVGDGLGVSAARDGRPEDWLTVLQGRGRGYATSTDDELALITRVARESGVLLDPVYSGKALCAFVKAVKADPARYQGKNVLFWHTGGFLGMFDKVGQLEPLVAPVERLIK